MAKKKITELVAEELSEFLEDNGYELFSVEFVKEAKEWYLRVAIDRAQSDEAVSTDDCEKVSRFLSDRLDELDPIEQNYYLEVSSPGMDRPLRNEADYQKYLGEAVDISLYRAVDGKKQITGILRGLSQGIVEVCTDEEGTVVRLPLEQIAKAKLAVVF